MSYAMLRENLATDLLAGRVADMTQDGLALHLAQNASLAPSAAREMAERFLTDLQKGLAE